MWCIERWKCYDTRTSVQALRKWYYYHSKEWKDIPRKRGVRIMETIARLEERTSKKGKKYTVLVIKLTDTYEKLVFLDKAEIELLKINN